MENPRDTTLRLTERIVEALDVQAERELIGRSALARQILARALDVKPARSAKGA